MNPIFLVQNVLIAIGMVLLFGIPVAMRTIGIDGEMRGDFFMLSHITVFTLMLIRPLADIFYERLWLRKLVILRKGLGILSASIVIGFMISSILAPGAPYIQSLATPAYWSIATFALFAHLGDITGLILLVTSNRLSQKILGRNWKRIQRLSYVYFYSGGIYAAFALNDAFALYTVLVVTNITALAWAAKKWRKIGAASLAKA